MPNGVTLSPTEQVALLRRIQDVVFPVVEGFTGGRPGESPLTRAALELFQQETLPIIQQQFQLQGLQGSPALGIATGRALSQALVPLLQQEQQLRFQAAGLPIQVGGLAAEFGRQAGQERIAQAEITSREAMLGRQLTAQEQAQIRELALAREMLQGAVGGTPTLQARQVALQERLEPQRFAFQQETGREQLTQSAAQLAAHIAAEQQRIGLQGLQTGGQLILGLTDPLAQAARLAQARQELSLRSIGAGGELQRSIAQEALDRAQADFLRRQALAEQATTGLFGGAVLPPALQQISRTTTSTNGSSK